MRKSAVRTTAAVSMLGGALLTLGGCGGDSGGVNSVSTTTTTSGATSTNVSLANLVASQSFANNAATQTATIDTTTENVTAGASTSQAVTVSYDVTSNSYTISTQGRSQTFGASNLSSAANGVAVYSITSGTTTDRLTLESASVTGYSSTYPQYSGLGYWQRTTADGSSSNVSVDFFIYGLDSTNAQVPRTGQAAYGTSVYGLVTLPGSEARFFQGTGRMDVDFLDGLFTTSASASETGIQSQTNYGNGVTIAGSGTLSSNANTLSGSISYTGLNSKSSGTLNGQFYGPAATELGAAFTTTGADGSSTSGVIWGAQNSTLSTSNLTLTNVVTDQVFAAQGAQLVTTSGGTSASIGAGTVELNPNGTTTVSPAGLTSTALTSSNTTTSSNANFTAYTQGSGTSAVTVDLYKQGSANSELALTYMNFGSWQGAAPSGGTATSWLVYGLSTTPSVIAARSGSANYTGVAYGTAWNSLTSTGAGVNGTASIAVNFDMGGYSGSFGLKTANVNYGTFNVSGTITSGAANPGSVTGATAGSGSIAPTFFGPAGQEFGGPFQISIPTANTTIVGAVATKGG